MEDAAMIEKAPQEGVYVYGLFIENAMWNNQARCIDEAALGVMSYAMPVLHFLPTVKASAAAEDFSYKCPVYKTNERAGVLSTTGKSTNYILSVDLPCTDDKDDDTKEQLRDKWMLRGVAMVTMLNE
jgi:dynein heavy chain, axonemal